MRPAAAFRWFLMMATVVALVASACGKSEPGTVAARDTTPASVGSTAPATTVSRVGTTVGTTPAPPQLTADEVASARDRWRSAGPAAYLWRYKTDCFCNGATFEVTVSGNKIDDVKIVDPGRSNYPLEAARRDAVTIDDLFGRIETAVAGGNPVYGSFDARLGYPTSVKITSQLPDGGQGGDFDTISFSEQTTVGTNAR